MISIESNLYVTHFVSRVGKDLGLLSELEADITQERSFWLNSGAAETMALMRINAFGSKPVPEYKLREQVGLEQGLMFGTVDTLPSHRSYANKILGQLSQRDRTKLNEIVNLEEEHRDNFQKAVKPL